MAHQHGSRWRGRGAGALGDAASFSFQQSKVPTCGRASAVTRNDDAVFETAFCSEARRMMSDLQIPAAIATAITHADGDVGRVPARWHALHRRAAHPRGRTHLAEASRRSVGRSGWPGAIRASRANPYYALNAPLRQGEGCRHGSAQYVAALRG